MGLTCGLRQLPANEIAGLIKSKRKLQALLVGDEENDELDDPAEEDLGPDWHAIHYLMTGQPDEATPPLDFLFYGGRDAPGADFGFGDGHIFDPTEVVRISRSLKSLKIAELRLRFNPAKMNRAQLYRCPFHADNLKDILDTFKRMREFIDRTAKDDLGLLVYFS